MYSQLAVEAAIYIIGKISGFFDHNCLRLGSEQIPEAGKQWSCLQCCLRLVAPEITKSHRRSGKGKNGILINLYIVPN